MDLGQGGDEAAVFSGMYRIVLTEKLTSEQRLENLKSEAASHTSEGKFKIPQAFWLT